jgi:hypothetical protein
MLQVFLHLERLERDEETDGTMDNLSKKMVRNRALSRSLSLQSKSTSYQSLQNEGAVITATTGHTDVPGRGRGRFQAAAILFMFCGEEINWLYGRILLKIKLHNPLLFSNTQLSTFITQFI